MKSIIFTLLLSSLAYCNPATPEIKETDYVFGIKVTKVETSKTGESPATYDYTIQFIRKKVKQTTPSVILDEPGVLPDRTTEIKPAPKLPTKKKK